MGEEILETALKEVKSDEAIGEIAWARASIKHLQKECKTLDRDDKIIKRAITLALRHKDHALYHALRSVLRGKLVCENCEFRKANVENKTIIDDSDQA